MPNASISRESEIEFNRWHVLCEEAKAVGIDPNKPKFNLLFRAIANWGESLVTFRNTQTQDQRDECLSMSERRYQDSKRKK